ncbi:hypothetical protein [Streptomyces sp. NBC_01187]|uniref:hypothetical protein n=1 Tax=Streptomyces sp. NBC_01187 TaxID=2903766 RepID=UPI002F913C89|nr:hypothetical protein OG220_42145 [Streptomyces sp. NBC_01187]
MTSPTGVQLTAAHAHVTVHSNTPAVTDWSNRYFGPWWNATPLTTPTPGPGPVVTADLDEHACETIANQVTASPHQKATYAKATLLLAQDASGTILGYSPTEGLAYRSEPASGHIAIFGRTDLPLALTTARIAREMIRAALLRDSWTLLHASAAVREGQAILTLGNKGAGKTTTALLLATRGAHLLANDRVFIKPVGDQLHVLPWPSAAAVGLGLLDALGLYDTVHDRLQAGEQLHPTQHPDVTEALLAGRRSPLWEPGGKRERKVQIFPDQFTTWFGMPLATGGRAAAMLFPRIDPAATPALAEGTRVLGEEDFMNGATEDRYPDHFGLARGINSGGDDHARHAVTDRLAALPHHQMVLGHNISANADFLTKLTDSI